ncbi:MAG: class I SAM-dependent methyltransferase [Eubacteriales bacterium]
MSNKKAEGWKSAELAERYLSGVRGAIPMAKEQIEIMLKLIEASKQSVRSFLDLGCGDGILASAILQKHPNAKGVLLDFSEPMIQAAKDKLQNYTPNLDFVIFDYSDGSWTNKVTGKAPFDVVVSGFSIHHQPDKRKQEIYAEIFNLLKPGGLFLNIEHVLSQTKWLNTIFENYLIDSLYELHIRQGGDSTRTQAAEDYYHRSDKDGNILASVEKQCEWLRKIGYQDVDCYFKVFELAIFGGRKPKG